MLICVARADADGYPTYVEAGPEVAWFYSKFGFRKVAECEMFGGEHAIQSWIRPVHGAETEGKSNIESVHHQG